MQRPGRAASGWALPLMWRVLLLLVIQQGLTVAATGGPINLSGRDAVLGCATSYGYVWVVRELGELPVGEARYPLKLVFNTNPADTPGAFGPYWRIPLLASTVVQFNQYKLYWDGPDERRQYFVLDASEKGRRGEKVYIERGKDWKATVDRRGATRIEALDGSAWGFIYDNGVLKSFYLGEAASRCRIHYSGRGLPLTITQEAGNRRLLEIKYRGSTEPEYIQLGDKRFSIQMGDAEVTAPDGVSSYRNYRVRFLRSLSYGEDRTEHFNYRKSGTQQRSLAVPLESGGQLRQTLNLALNRLEITDPTGKASDNWIEWEAKSGFVTADSGSEYTVENPSWDPNRVEGPLQVNPDSVQMVRRLNTGGEQQWSYDWNSGVRVFTDLATGELIRRTHILSEGPANGKLRKREVFKDGQWILDRKNSYDPKGRPIRAMHGDDMRIWKWEDSHAGSKVTEYLNGNLVSCKAYDLNGISRELMSTDAEGNMFEIFDDGAIIKVNKNGKLIYQYEK